MIEQLSKIMPWPAAFELATLALIGLSILLFRYVEGPGKRLILTLTSGSSPTLAAKRQRRPSSLPRTSEQPLPSTISNG